MMMWKKVLILLFATVALVHVSRASPTELPSSIHDDDEQVMETTTILPSSGDSDVVVGEYKLPAQAFLSLCIYTFTCALFHVLKSG